MKSLQKAFYRQISQSTIADTGYKLCDILGLDNSSAGSLSVEKLPSLCDTQNPQHPYNDIDRDQRNAKYTDRSCKDISSNTCLSIRRKAEKETRRRPSTFKNMPFLHVKDALLEARRASSLTSHITFWFSASYNIVFKQNQTPFVRAFILVLCNDFLLRCKLFRYIEIGKTKIVTAY